MTAPVDRLLGGVAIARKLTLLVIGVGALGCVEGQASRAPTPPIAIEQAPPQPPAAAPATSAALPTPTADRDHDGVLDSDDACPDVPGIRAEDPKRRGCPSPPAFGCKAILKRWITFEENRVAFRGESRQWLDDLVGVMNAHPDERFEVLGHAAAEEKNPKALSLRRAQVTKAALVAGGVDPRRLVVRGDGANTVHGRCDYPDTRNRWVDLMFLKRAAPVSHRPPATQP